MAIARPKTTTSEETTRALIRELHETIQDGRTFLRELRAALAEADGKTAQVQADTNKVLAELQAHIDGIADVVQQQLDESSEAMSQQINRLLGMKDGYELLKDVSAQVVPVIREAVLIHVEKKLPHIAHLEIKRLAQAAGPRNANKAQVAYEAAERALLKIADTGADGTVPGRDSH